METGHAKNVANFETIIIILTALGVNYNPAQALILLPALQTKLTEAKAALDAVDAAEAEYAVKVDEIQAEMEGLYKWVVNLKRTVEVDINDEAFTGNMQTIVNRFNSESRKTGIEDDPNTPEDESRTARSTSQRSRDNQIAYVADILALINTKRELYTTTDAEYTIEGIEAKLARMNTKNNTVRTAYAARGNAYDNRDRVLYDKDTGVLKLVKLIKTQLARKPGKQSAAYQQINALEFSKP